MAIREKKRCVFTKDETMLIINLWREEKVQAKFRTTLKHNFIWDQLSRTLSDFGYIKTGNEIKRKIQNLKHEYKTMKQLPGYDITSWPYYSILHDIMERRLAEKNETIEDDHDYAEHETDDHSGTGWMLMEFKDIAQANAENFTITEEPLNPVESEIVNETEIEDTEIISNTLDASKLPSQTQLNTRTFSTQIPKFNASTPNKTTVKRIRKPFRYNNINDRKIIRMNGSENRVMERLTAIQERERRIDERERRINDREMRIEERERRIDEREKRIDERERRVEENERFLKEREKGFEERDKRYEERESRGSDAMCRFFDTCTQFISQYNSPFSNATQVDNSSCTVQDTQTF